jgi:hypothetical protein
MAGRQGETERCIFAAFANTCRGNKRRSNGSKERKKGEKETVSFTRSIHFTSDLKWVLFLYVYQDVTGLRAEFSVSY